MGPVATLLLAGGYRLPAVLSGYRLPAALGGYWLPAILAISWLSAVSADPDCNVQCRTPCKPNIVLVS
jgi:hypothetical protein